MKSCAFAIGEGSSRFYRDEKSSTFYPIEAWEIKIKALKPLSGPAGQNADTARHHEQDAIGACRAKPGAYRKRHASDGIEHETRRRRSGCRNAIQIAVGKLRRPFSGQLVAVGNRCGEKVGLRSREDL